MAAAIGHNCPVTTGRYYWTEDVIAQVSQRLDAAGKEADDKQEEADRRRLCDLHQQIAIAKAQLVKSPATEQEQANTKQVHFAAEPPSHPLVDIDSLFSSLLEEGSPKNI